MIEVDTIISLECRWGKGADVYGVQSVQKVSSSGRRTSKRQRFFFRLHAFIGCIFFSCYHITLLLYYGSDLRLDSNDPFAD